MEVSLSYFAFFKEPNLQSAWLKLEPVGSPEGTFPLMLSEGTSYVFGKKITH